MRGFALDDVDVERRAYKRRARFQRGAGSGVGKCTASIERASQAHRER
jgi:hypothetical protein